jgi:hypothetical protein
MTQEVALELELVVPSPVDAATSVRATLTCVICGVPLIAPARGRRPMYCSSTCRQTAQRTRAPQ